MLPCKTICTDISARKLDSREDLHGTQSNRSAGHLLFEREAYLSPVLGVALHRAQLMNPMRKLALASVAALACCRPGAAQLSLQAQRIDSALACKFCSGYTHQSGHLTALYRPRYKATDMQHKVTGAQMSHPVQYS